MCQNWWLPATFAMYGLTVSEDWGAAEIQAQVIARGLLSRRN